MPPTAPPPGVERKHDQCGGELLQGTCSVNIWETLDFRMTHAVSQQCYITAVLLLQLYICLANYTLHKNAHVTTTCTVVGRTLALSTRSNSLQLHYTMSIEPTLCTVCTH